MPRNILLVCLDSVRADFFSGYAPRLQDLADVSFSQCRSASSWTIPSHGSMMTGRLPSEHGAHGYNSSFYHLSRADTWLANCQKHKSIGVSSNPYASSDFGFDGLFDEFLMTRPGKYFPSGMSVDSFGWDRNNSGLPLYRDFLREAVRHDHTAASLLNAIIHKSRDVLESCPIPQLFDDGARRLVQLIRRRFSQSDEPIIGFMNLMEAHEPMVDLMAFDSNLYDVPRGWASSGFSDIVVGEADEPALERYRSVYSAAIDYLDRKMSELIESLLKDHDLTVVLTADHGENLGYDAEDHLFGHTGSLSEATLHVPLLIVNPPPSAPTGTTDGYASQMDLPDLLTEMANDDWTDITRDVVGAERVGGTQWINNDGVNNYEFWDRTIRAAYRGDTKIEWDSLGNVYRISLGQQPCTRKTKEEIDSVPSWATSQFRQSIETDRNEARLGGHQTALTDDVERRLRDFGYL